MIFSEIYNEAQTCVCRRDGRGFDSTRGNEIFNINIFLRSGNEGKRGVVLGSLGNLRIWMMLFNINILFSFII